MAKPRERKAAGTSAEQRREADDGIVTLIFIGTFHYWEDVPPDAKVVVGTRPADKPDIRSTGLTEARLRADQWRELAELPGDTEVTIFRIRRSN